MPTARHTHSAALSTTPIFRCTSCRTTMTNSGTNACRCSSDCSNKVDRQVDVVLSISRGPMCSTWVQHVWTKQSQLQMCLYAAGVHHSCCSRNTPQQSCKPAQHFHDLQRAARLLLHSKSAKVLPQHPAAQQRTSIWVTARMAEATLLLPLKMSSSSPSRLNWMASAAGGVFEPISARTK